MRIGIVLAWLVALVAAGCGKPQADPLRRVLPDIPVSSDFGPLYPRVARYLQPSNPDVYSALRDTLAWARDHLGGFSDGSCASASIVYDAEFARIFGKTTLGVTFPWMQIYIRDGARVDDPFLWKDPSLFVSTVLHEVVHAIQRARQANAFLGASGCESARNALESRRSTWTSGFDSLRSSVVLGSGYSRAEASLLYRWSSPIQRAKDEVEAAVATVRWMRERPEELNALTVGGANNWAYGVQFLNQLKALATSNCFSPDDDAYAEELRLYAQDIPAHAAELQSLEADMRYFLTQHGIPVVNHALAESHTGASPSGRMGSRCNLAGISELPRYPFPSEIHSHPEH